MRRSAAAGSALLCGLAATPAAGPLDADTGSIEVGKLADLGVLDRNLFAISPSQISEAEVVATLLGGEVVHGALP